MIKIETIEQALALRGKTIYIVSTDGLTACSRCGGTGKVEVIYTDTKESGVARCPKCYGTGTLYGQKHIVEDKNLDVVAILIGGGYRDRISLFHNSPDRYLPYNEMDYFLTREEAVAEAKKRNSEAGK